MLLSVYELAEKLGCSSSTIKDKYMKNDEAIKSLFHTIKIRGSYNNTTYRKIVFNDKNLDTLKARIFDYEYRLKLQKEKKKKMNGSIKDCMANDLNCFSCSSTNKLACRWFLAENEIPPIKKLALEVIDQYGETIG